MSLRGRMVIVACLVLFCALGIYGCFLGYGTDRDSVRVIESAPGILAGHYQRSRSYGFPLHELAAALLFALGGIWAVNFGALLAALAGIAAALRVAGQRGVPVAAALCACPVVLVNSSVAVDFAWSFAAGMALLLAACRRRAAWFGAAVLAACALRPDNVLFVGAVCLAAMGRDWRFGARLCWVAALACVMAGTVYLMLNGAGVFGSGVTTTRPWLARLARAGVFAAGAFGPGGVLLAWCLPWRQARAAALPVLAAMFCLVIYVPRFVALPDQLDYLILPVGTTVLAGLMVAPARLVWPAVTLVALPAVVSFSVFARGADGALGLSPAIQAGAVAQDFSARRFNAALDAEAMRRFVGAALPVAAAAGLHADTFMPGYTNAHHDLILGAWHLYAVLPTGTDLARLATVPRRFYADVYACDAPLGAGIGWRGLEAPESTEVLDRAVSGGRLLCWCVGAPKDR